MNPYLYFDSALLNSNVHSYTCSWWYTVRSHNYSISYCIKFPDAIPTMPFICPEGQCFIMFLDPLQMKITVIQAKSSLIYIYLVLSMFPCQHCHVMINGT